MNIATTSYWNRDGRPISARRLLENLFGDLSEIVTDEDYLRRVERSGHAQEIFDRLSEKAYDLARLNDIRSLIGAPDSDLFDVLRCVRFALEPKTRRERAEDLRKRGLSEFDCEMRSLLLHILEDYENRGESELTGDKLAAHLTARYGGVGESWALLGELVEIKAAYRRMQAELYAY